MPGREDSSQPTMNSPLQDPWNRDILCGCLSIFLSAPEKGLLLLNLFLARLPNKLCLWKQKVDLLDIHGLGISSNSNAEPLFVGFRNGSRMKSNITSVELCRGKFWYGKYAGPFLKASQDCEDKLNIQFRSYMPEHRGKRRLTAVKVNTSWSFIMEIPRPDDNVLVAEAFEWRHHQKYRVGASEQHQEGYVLVQLSTQQAVALLSLSGRSILSSDIQIEYLGSGTIYGGLWKLIAFVVGIFGTSDIPRARRRSSSFWPRR